MATLARVLPSIRNGWKSATGPQRLLLVLGVANLIAGLVHVGVFAVLGGPWDGPLSWRKVVSFSLAVGMMNLCVAWTLGFLHVRRSWVWGVVVMLALGSLLNPPLVVLQQWRGTTSHFNWFTGPFNSLVAALILLGASLAWLSLTIVAAWSWLRMRSTTASERWALRYGLTMMSFGTFLGYGVAAAAGPRLQAGRTHGLTIYGQAGLVKVPHLLAMHGLELMALLLLLFAMAAPPEPLRRKLLSLTIAGHLGVVAISLALAYSGRGPFDVSVILGAVALAALLAMIGPLVFAAAAALRRPTGPG